MKTLVHLESQHIHELTLKGELVKIMFQTFKNRNLGEDLSPPRFAVGPNEKSQMGIMPELSRNYPNIVQTKFVSLAQGSGHEGEVMQFDANTGKLIAIISGKIFTSYRTAATSVAVAKFFKPKAKRITLIGTGEQAHQHCEFFLSQYEAARITIVGRSESSLENLRKKISNRNLVFTTAVTQGSAEIICTLTSSPTPVLTRSDVDEKALVIAVGSCHPRSSELTSELIRSSVCFVDSLPQAKRETSDFSHATEIGQLFRDELLPRENRTIIFKSLGLAEQDISYASYLLEKYNECR